MEIVTLACKIAIKVAFGAKEPTEKLELAAQPELPHALLPSTVTHTAEMREPLAINATTCPDVVGAILKRLALTLPPKLATPRSLTVVQIVPATTIATLAKTLDVFGAKMESAEERETLLDA